MNALLTTSERERLQAIKGEMDDLNKRYIHAKLHRDSYLTAKYRDALNKLDNERLNLIYSRAGVIKTLRAFKISAAKPTSTYRGHALTYSKGYTFNSPWSITVPIADADVVESFIVTLESNGVALTSHRTDTQSGTTLFEIAERK